jgi:hypothetical protein
MKDEVKKPSGENGQGWNSLASKRFIIYFSIR